MNIPLTGVPLREELGGASASPCSWTTTPTARRSPRHSSWTTPRRAVLVMLTLGTGVGGGVVIGGEIFRGAHGLGAELGHFTIDPDGPAVPRQLPGRGCLEAYCSGQALERDATEVAQGHAGQRARPAPRRGRQGPRPRVVTAARDGDADALAGFERFGACSAWRSAGT